MRPESAQVQEATAALESDDQFARVDTSSKATASESDGRWLRAVVVPVMLFTSSLIMAMAWLGHLRFKQLPFLVALFYCWLLVLPEYFVNISAIRIGYKVYSGAQMASFRLCSGVVCVALVSRYFLGEALTTRDVTGFSLMVVAMLLITVKELPRKGSTRRAEQEGQMP